MRTPEEYVDLFQEHCVSSTGLSAEARKDLINIFKVAQTEAWNEAIEIAAENAETKEIGDKYGHWLADVIDEDSILKLKK